LNRLPFVNWLHVVSYYYSLLKQKSGIIVAAAFFVFILLATTKEVFGSEVFSQFWKNTAVFSNTAVLYTEWCLASWLKSLFSKMKYCKYYNCFKAF
jgi:hypothetical protein